MFHQRFQRREDIEEHSLDNVLLYMCVEEIIDLSLLSDAQMWRNIYYCPKNIFVKQTHLSMLTHENQKHELEYCLCILRTYIN